MKPMNQWSQMMSMAQKGDAKMYNQLLIEVSDYLSKYLNYKLRSSQYAQDLLQEILVSIHKARHTYNAELPFKPWLMTITQSRLIDFWRKSSRSATDQSTVDVASLEALSAEA